MRDCHGTRLWKYMLSVHQSGAHVVLPANHISIHNAGLLRSVLVAAFAASHMCGRSHLQPDIQKALMTNRKPLAVIPRDATGGGLMVSVINVSDVKDVLHLWLSFSAL